MECYELLLEISRVHESNKKLKGQDDFLIMFAENPPLSVYQIYNSHKHIHKLKYNKRVRKIVKHLLNSKLIEKVEGKISKRRVVYYRLSAAGLYYLAYNKNREFIGLFKRILQHYDQNVLFTTLLYPYLQKSSLEMIRETTLISRVCTYLHECCEEIQNALESIEKSYSRNVVQQVCLWNDVHERGEDNYRLIDFIKHEFGLSWLDKGVEVTKYGNNDTVKISKDNKRILLKLNESRTEATMTVNGQEVYTFSISPMFEILYRQKQTIEEWSASFVKTRFESLAADLTIALALRAMIDCDIETLSHDKKFMLALEENKKKFLEKYRKLFELHPGS